MGFEGRVGKHNDMGGPLTGKQNLFIAWVLSSPKKFQEMNKLEKFIFGLHSFKDHHRRIEESVAWAFHHVVDAYKACREIHDAVLGETRPGGDCEALFMKSLELAEKLGYKDSYLGPPGLQTRFIGHGIGLELNELPFIAKGQSYPLEKGMTFALEPKIE
jgi:Xaa-Pro aminopeptidase